MKKRFAVLLLTALLSGIGLSTGASGEKKVPDNSLETGTVDSGIRVGMTMYSLQNEYTVRVAEAAQAQANELGIHLKIYDGNYDAALQVTQIERMIQDGVDGILLNPQDADKCIECVKMASEYGIPVVAVNTRVNSGLISSYVGSDDREAGRLLMQRIVDEIGGRGNIVILEGPAGQSAQVERQEGMLDVLKEYEDVNVISVKHANWSRLEAESIMKKWLETFDRIDAVAAENDDMALGAADAISRDGREIAVAGIDGAQDAVQAVLDERFLATVYQNAKEQGSTAVTCLYHLLIGDTVEEEYEIPLELITREHAAEYLEPVNGEKQE